MGECYYGGVLLWRYISNGIFILLITIMVRGYENEHNCSVSEQAYITVYQGEVGLLKYNYTSHFGITSSDI